MRKIATAGAFHTHFMASALDGYSAAADAVTASEPTTSLLSNADGQPVGSAADAIAKLVAQLTQPVRWDLCTETMRQREVTAIIEQYRAACVEAVAEFDGYIDDHRGDGMLVLFGYPQVDEDDARRGV